MSVFNFPEVQTNVRYKARGPGTKNYHADQYARLLISVGQPYHEGAKLAAAVKWAKDNFQKQVIFLADTLQRYNMIMDGMDPDQAMDLSKRLGNEWLERNQEIISGIEVFRWDQAITGSDYIAAKDQIDRFCNESIEAKEALEKAICEVAHRRQVPDSEFANFFALSKQYLLEEAAGKAVENELYPGVSAYPGSTPDIWTLFSSAPDYSIPTGLINDNVITLELKRA